MPTDFIVVPGQACMMPESAFRDMTITQVYAGAWLIVVLADERVVRITSEAQYTGKRITAGDPYVAPHKAEFVPPGDRTGTGDSPLDALDDLLKASSEELIVCPMCRGDGWYMSQDPGDLPCRHDPCDACDGTGKVLSE